MAMAFVRPLVRGPLGMGHRACSTWAAVKGAKRAVPIHNDGSMIVSDFLEKVREKEKPGLDKVRLSDLELYKSKADKEGGGKPMEPDEAIPKGEGTTKEDALYVDYDVAATKKFFRARQLAVKNVPFVEGGELPEEILRLVVKDDADLEDNLRRLSVRLLAKAGTKESAAYDDIVSEQIADWKGSDDNVAFDAHLDFGLLSSSCASKEVQGYHDALEAEAHEWLTSHSKGKARPLNEGLYHQSHRHQVFMQGPQDTAERERDGFILYATKAALVSVKSRFEPSHLKELLDDIGADKNQPDQVPTIDLNQWTIKDASGTLVPLLSIYKKLHPKSKRQTLPIIAASPVFTPGAWQMEFGRMKCLRKLQRVGWHEWQFEKSGDVQGDGSS